MPTLQSHTYRIRTMPPVDQKCGKCVPVPTQEEFTHGTFILELLGRMIRATRKEQNLTQEELGALIGINKSQVSKLENHTNSATIETILKVFKALKAEINFNVKLENNYIQLA